MAVRTSFTAGEVLAAADLTDTFGAKLNLAGGKVLQIVRATDATARSTSSASFVDASINVTITPQRTTSSILLINTFEVSYLAGGITPGGGFQITDNSNNPISGAQEVAPVIGGISATVEGYLVLIAHATPATISPVTYKLRFTAFSTARTVTLVNNKATGQMYAIEVSA